MTQPNRMPIAGLKPKDLVGIPWRLAFALQADGWWLRSDIIWSKPNPMPESVTDRPTKAHEYIFLLTKSERYFYDAEAIKEKASQPQGVAKLTAQYKADAGGFTNNGHGASTLGTNQGQSERNKRTVWTIATQAYPEAHFATFPEALIEPCILAGTSEKGCCSDCGRSWERLTESFATGETQKMADGWAVGDYAHGTILEEGRRQGESGKPVMAQRTVGWEPGCDCHGNGTVGHMPIVPCTVLDPFSGSGTTGVVSLRYHRNYIGIELSPAYAELSKQRITQDSPMFNEVSLRDDVEIQDSKVSRGDQVLDVGGQA